MNVNELSTEQLLELLNEIEFEILRRTVKNGLTEAEIAELKPTAINLLNTANNDIDELRIELVNDEG